jgi:outer membrane protein
MNRNKLNLLRFGMVLAIAIGAISAQAQDLKIGIVDTEQAFSSTDEGKKVVDELQRKQREAEAEIKPMIDRYRALAEEIQAKKFVLSEEALLAKQGEVANLEATIKSRQQELQSKLETDQVIMLRPLQKKLQTTIATIGKEGGYTMIVERNAPFLMYSREALDITDLVVAKFNGS